MTVADASESPLRPSIAWLALLCALPVALAWTPWTGWVGALAALALPWLARRIVGARPYAPWAAVYAALCVLLTPPYSLESLVTGRFVAFFSTLVLGYLIGAALDGVRERSPWAWLAPLLCVAVFPTPLGVAGGLGLAMLSRLEGRPAFRSHLPFSALLGAAGLVAVAALLSVALPAPGAWFGGLIAPATPVSSGSSKVDARPSTNLEDAARVSARARQRLPPRDNLAENDWLYLSVNLLLLVGVAGIAVVVIYSRAQPGQGFKRRQLWDIVPLLAVLILMVVLVVWSGLAPSARDGSAEGFAASSLDKIRTFERGVKPEVSPLASPDQPRSASSVTPWLILLGAVALGYVLWRSRPRSYGFAPPTDPEPDQPSVPSELATDEVRLCYRRFLELTRTAGMPRGEAETPLEFAARLASLVPEAERPALQLTRRYEPVRYGQLAAQTQALEAKTALAAVEQTLTRIPPRAEPTVPGVNP